MWHETRERSWERLLRRDGTVLYRPEVDLRSVRDAYSSMSEQYIGMVGDGSQEHEADVDLVGRHLSGLAGPVLDLGCGPEVERLRRLVPERPDRRYAAIAARAA